MKKLDHMAYFTDIHVDDLEETPCQPNFNLASCMGKPGALVGALGTATISLRYYSYLGMKKILRSPSNSEISCAVDSDLVKW